MGMYTGVALVKLALDMSAAKACTQLRLTRSVITTKFMKLACGTAGCCKME